MQGYQRAELITQEELAFIKKVERQPKAKVESLLLSEGRTYSFLYLSLLKKLQRVDPIQCLLVLITDALQGRWQLQTFLSPTSNAIEDHDERIPLFLKAAESDPELPYLPLLRCKLLGPFVESRINPFLLRALSSQDEFVQLKSAQILTVLLRSVHSFFKFALVLLHY